MSIFQSPDQIVALRNLLQPSGENADNSDSDNDEPLIVKPQINKAPSEAEKPIEEVPEATTSKKKSKKKYSPYDKIDKNETDINSSICLPHSFEEWEQQEEKHAELLETRKCPDYTFTYRQAVGTEDVYLQMGNRTNATSSCEDLLIDIKLPGDPTSSDKMELNLSVNEIILSTSVYYLRLPLSDLIDVDRCEAKFDREQETLTLKLRLKREYDFINF